ncbi:beta strand repeat-containing protein [Altererythrobacter aquiaggeris]|uniref:beta strand repeat-containing protein n=1 Tax=Aestuarierythrobacter aquiaggeris TaxID=1898396 RepID=UPI00301B1F09
MTDYQGPRDNDPRDLDPEANLAQDSEAFGNAPGQGNVIQPGPDNVVVLPEGVSLDGLRVVGRDLIIELADGTRMVIPDGAIFVPQLVIDGVTVPAANLAALLVGNEPEPAAGGNQSSGGNFFIDAGDIQAAYALGDLLPYTELAFPRPEEREIIPGLEDEEDLPPQVIIITPDNPAGATTASDTVAEAGLPARGSEPAGSDSASNSETTTGTIRFAAPDGLGSISINGTPITTVGQTITTDFGVLSITSIAPGTIGYSYTLTDNKLDNASIDSFAVQVVDIDGDVANATLDIAVIDDAPSAVNDVDTIAAATYGPAVGNVMTGAGTVAGAAGADTPGADGARLTSIQYNGNTVSGTGPLVINGAYGTLTIQPDGGYSYVRAPGTPGGVTDAFTYTLTDGDGDRATATLTINIGDAPATIISVPTTGAGTVVDEAGLPERGTEAPGTEAPLPVESTSGTINVAAPDGIATVEINGIVITGPGQVITVPEGKLVIVSYNPVTGEIGYTFTLGDNTTGNDTSVDFEIKVTDIDGDSDTDTLTITILDDVPDAIDDSATQDPTNENAPITIDVFDNDIEGADSVQLDTIVLVDGSLSGRGTLTNNGDGTFTYVPAPGEEGQVTFKYQITDGDGDSDIATVTITLQEDSKPDVVNVTALSDDDALAGGNAASSVGDINANAGDNPLTASEAVYSGQITVDFGGDTGTVNFANLDGTTGMVGTEMVSYAWNSGTNTLTATGPRGALFTVSLTPSGAFVLTQVDNVLHAAGNDEASAPSVKLNYRAADSDGDIDDTGSLTITFNDDAPTATNDGIFDVAEQFPLEIDALANDGFGADGVSLASGVTIVTGPTKGVVTYDAATGKFTYTPGAGEQGADSFQYQITDADGDVAIATVALNLLEDSIPTVVASDLIVDEDGLPDRNGDDKGSNSGSNSETDTGTLTITTGADTLAKVEIQDKNGVYIDVTAATVAAPVVVQGDAGSLTVTSDGAGNYSYSYTLAVNDPTHPDFDPADGDGISGADDELPGDSFNVRVTDSDGSVGALDSIDVTVRDDAPSATADDTATLDMIVLDESPVSEDGIVSATANFADNFETDIAYGADGAGSTSYGLVLTGTNVNSGLFALGANGLPGAQIVLNQAADGVVTGSVGAVAYFTISVAAGTGVVTFTQSKNVYHSNSSNPDDTSALSAAAGALVIRQTVTDGDGDSASAGVDLSNGVFKIEDDGPSASVNGSATLDMIVLDESPVSKDGIVSATANFADNFAAVTNYGTDGAGSTSYGLVLTGTNVNSGLFALGANGLPGAQIVLNQAADGVVTGSVGAVAYFTISVAAGTGVVTFTQSKNVYHSNSSNPDDTSALSAAAGALVIRQTVTDGDGDSASAGVDLSNGVFKIEDDGPSASASAVGAGVVHDETPGLDGDAKDVAGPLAVTATNAGDDPDVAGTGPIGYAKGTVALSSAGSDTGTDGGTIAISLTLSANGVDSGLDTTDGTSIFLFKEGAVVVGRIGANATVAATGVAAFAVGIESDGTLGLVQYLSIRHTNVNNPDESAFISAGVLFTTTTVKDADGDVATASASIGDLIGFQDDAPVVFDPENGEVANTDSPPTSFDLNYGTAVGADGLGDVVFSIVNGSPALDSNNNVLSYQGSALTISGNGTNVLTATNGNGVVGFTITINPDTDQYVVDLAGTISNGGEFSIANLTGANAGNAQFRAVGADSANNNSDNIDIILSGRGSDGLRGTVNTRVDSIGINNQATNPGEAVRIDFVNNATSGGAGVTGFDFDGHQDVIRFEQAIPQTGQGGAAIVSINVTAIVADDDQVFGFSGTTPEAGESFVDIEKVVVTRAGGTELTFTSNSTSGGVTVTFNANGSVRIDGLGVGDKYEINTDDTFSAVLVESPPGNNVFDLGLFNITTVNSAQPINVAYDIVGTDGDGDKVTVIDGIDVTFTPATAPIVLDLDGDGAEFLDLSAGVAFDYGGGLVATAWVGSDDGLLARDTGSGLDIVFADDAAGASTDLEGLALAHDSNRDGQFDAADAGYGNFGVWQDANSNGVFDAGEFTSLADAGITSIDLTSDGIVYSAANDDVVVHGTGLFTRADGTTGQLADVSFSTGRMDQRTAEMAVTAAAAAAFLVGADPQIALAAAALSLAEAAPGKAEMLEIDYLVIAEGPQVARTFNSESLFEAGSDGPQQPEARITGDTEARVSLDEVEARADDGAQAPVFDAGDRIAELGEAAGNSAFSMQDSSLMESLLAITAPEATDAGRITTEALPEARMAVEDVLTNGAVDEILDQFAGVDAALGGDAVPHIAKVSAALFGQIDGSAFAVTPDMTADNMDDVSALAAAQA